MTGCETRHSLRDLQRSEEAPTEFPHTEHWAAGVTCYIASRHRSSRVCGWNASLRNLDRACRRSRGFTSPKTVYSHSGATVWLMPFYSARFRDDLFTPESFNLK